MTCFDLDKYDKPFLLSDDIDFTATLSIIPFKNFVAFLPEILSGIILALITGLFGSVFHHFGRIFLKKLIR